MNAQQPLPNFDATMRSRRILAILPPASKDRTKFIVSILQAAKERWGCHIDVVCGRLDQKPFASLVGPTGKCYCAPPWLKIEHWENSAEHVAEVERRLRDAERVSGVPTGRVILAGAHSAGRALTAWVRHPPRYRMVTKVLQDNMEPYRIVRRLFRFADQTLADCKPDLVIAYEFSTPANFMLRLAAYRRGIPSAGIRFSKINSEHMYWSTDPITLNDVAIEAGTARREARLPTSDAAKEYIRTFRDKPRIVGFVASKWRHRMRQTFFRWHLSYARVVLNDILAVFSEPDKSLREPALGRLFRYYRSHYLSYRQSFLCKTLDDETLADMKYIYFPLHKEAEHAQMYQATFWHNQINTVRILASILPMGYRLLVREHRLNNGQRPTRYFKELAQIPGVTVIDAFDSQFKYLRHAAVIVTENGSSGWEGLLLKKRVLLLSRTFYDGAGLGMKVTDPDKLNAALLDLLSREPVADEAAHDYAIGSMIDAESTTTFPVKPQGLPIALDRLAGVVGPLIGARNLQTGAAAS